MMTFLLATTFLVLGNLAHFTNGHNTYYDCSRVALDIGLTVMGQVTTFSADRVIQVSRGGVALSSGDTFTPGEVLSVSMSDSSGEILLEASGGAQFSGGACTGSPRFYGGSTEVTMGNNDAQFWGGWALGYGTVSISAKFELVSSGASVTTEPSLSTTASPTVFIADGSSYSLDFVVATTGVTTDALHEEVASLGSVFCGHLSLDDSLCLITFMSSSQVTTDELQFNLLVTDFIAEGDASDASTALRTYVSDSSAGGFVEEFFTASGLRFTLAVYQSSDITESSTFSGDLYSYSCDLSDNLKLSWQVKAQGDGTSTGHAGGYIVGSLTMLSSGSTPWFAAGVVENDALTMVDSPQHTVYFYEPNSQQAGMYRVTAYSSAGIVADTRIRADTGVMAKHSSQSSTSVDFQQSRHTDVSSDPVLALDSEEDFNTIIWAHGGVWPNAHTSSNRGFSTVYWLEGACVASSEEEPNTWKWFLLYVAVLVAIGITVSHLDRTSLSNTRVVYHFRRTLRQLLPSSIPLTHDMAAFTLRSSIATASFMAIVAIFMIQTATFYEDEKGYDSGRAYSFSLGFAALFCAGLTIIPVNKTGIVVALFRIPFDRATKFHRVCGATTMVLVMFHAIQIIDFWGSSEVITLDTKKEVGDEAYPAFGVLAACCFAAMALTAPYPIRSRAYELFQLVHCLFLPAMLCIMLHVPERGAVLIPSLVLYALDVIYRVYQWFLPVTVVSLTSPQSRYTVLKVKAGHLQDIKPGQFCMVNIAPASFFQWHPISICSYDRSTHEVTFIIKNVGDWTAKICSVVNGNSFDASNLHQCKVRLCGPYGRIRFDISTDPESEAGYKYEKIILVAGGIGCTPMISTLQWLMDDAMDRGLEHSLHVTVLITARDREMFSLFGDFFRVFNDSKAFQKGGIDLRLYCTTNPRVSEDEPGLHSLEIQSLRPSELHSNSDFVGSVANLTVPITYARPDVGSEIDVVCECRESTQGKVCVMVCGPAGIVTAVQKGCHAAIQKFGPVLDLHEESFRI